MAASDAKPIPRRDQAYRLTFEIRDADGDPVTGASGLDSEVDLDAAGFSDCTNEATEIGNGVYYIDLTADEMDADTVTVVTKTSTTGAKQATTIITPDQEGDINVRVEATAELCGLPTVLVEGTIDSATTTTATDAGLVGIDNAGLVNAMIVFRGGTYAYAVRRISSFDGSTGTITFSPALPGSPGAVMYFVTPHISEAYPDNFSSLSIDGSGRVAANVTQISGDSGAADNAEAFFDGTGYAGTNNVIPTVTTVSNQLSAATIAAAVRDVSNASPAVGSLGEWIVNGATYAASGAGYAEAANTSATTLLNRLGAFTGSGVNTVLGFFKALLSKTASTPSDVGGTFDATTDSTEAIRDNMGSSAPTANQNAAAVWGFEITELTEGECPASPTAEQALALQHMAMRNGIDTTKDRRAILNDSGDEVLAADMENDGGTFRPGKLESP